MNTQSIPFIIFFAIFAFLFNKAGCTIYDSRPNPTSKNDSLIMTNTEPKQNPTARKPFVRIIDGISTEFTPIADYTIAGRVVSKSHYYVNWESKLAPVDLAIAWGDLLNEKYTSVEFSHGNRFYNYRVGADLVGEIPFIGRHSANEHLIPADPYIKKVLKSIKVNEVIEISGFLVNVKTLDQKQYRLNTSVRRDDTGGGACEVIFVTEVKIGNETFTSIL